MDSALAQKEARLDARLRELGNVLVAYSGGVDSAYLAWRARQVLGKAMRAAIADSPSLARRHFADAVAFAREHAIPLEIVPPPSWKIPTTRRTTRSAASSARTSFSP